MAETEIERQETTLTVGSVVEIDPDSVQAFGLARGPWLVTAIKPAWDQRAPKSKPRVRLWASVTLEGDGETWSLPAEDLKEVLTVAR